MNNEYIDMQLKTRKREIRVDAIELLDGYPRVGSRCKLRLHVQGTYRDILTSDVIDWHQGYPYAVGRIFVETRNSRYSGAYIG